MTNDGALQRLCKRHGVATRFGLGLMVDLVAAGALSRRRAVSVGRRMQVSNPRHINTACWPGSTRSWIGKVADGSSRFPSSGSSRTCVTFVTQTGPSARPLNRASHRSPILARNLRQGFVLRGGSVATASAGVFEVVEEPSGVEFDKEFAIAVLVKEAVVANVGDQGPIGVVVQGLPSAEFKQNGHVAVLAGQFARKAVGEEAKVVFAFGDAACDQVHEKHRIAVSAEEVPGVKVAFAPGLLRTLDKLPVVRKRGPSRLATGL